MMKARFLLLLASITACVASAQTVQGVNTVESALPGLAPILQTAAQQSPRMLTKALDLEIAENNRIQSRSAILPNVGGSFRFNETQDDRADLPDPVRVQKSYYDFQITQPLFHWGERRNTARIGEIYRKMADGNFREGYRSLAQELRSKYTLLISLKLSITRARAALAFAEQQVKLGEDRLAKKVISESEMVPLRIAVEQGQIVLDRVEFDFDVAKKSFARLSGTPVLADEQIPDSIPPVKYDAATINRLLGEFLGQKELPTPEAINSRYSRQVAELNLANEKTRLRPKFSLNAGVNQDEQAYTINTAQKYRVNSYYAGLSVTWTLFDGFASQAGRRNALARLRQAEIEQNEVANRLAETAQQQAKVLGFTARAVAIADRGLDGAEGALKARISEFERGSITEAEVTMSRISLIDARISAYNTRAELLWRMTDFLGTIAADPAVGYVPAK